MSRIKKRGLDYFPMNTDFIHDHLVRRILKREGDTRYNLSSAEETTDRTPADNGSSNETDAKKNADGNNENADKINKIATFIAGNDENTHQSTQSIEKQSKGKQSIENSLLNSSPETGGTDCAARKSAREEEEKEEELSSTRTGKTPHEWTDEDISRLQPPKDGLQWNPEGLIYNLRQLRIPLNEQYAIILKSNFGVIGHPMWKGFGTLRESHGKIRQPGCYLLSLCKPTPPKT